MSREIDSAAVRRCACFQGLTEEQAAAAAARMSPVRLAKGEVLFRQGDQGDSAYLIMSGRIAIAIHVPGQDDRSLAPLEPGAIFGEIGLLLPEPRTATVTAAEDAELWEITLPAFEAALEQGEAWACRFLYATAQIEAARLAALDRELVGLIAELKQHAAGGASAPAPAARVAELEQLRNRLFSEWSF